MASWPLVRVPALSLVLAVAARLTSATDTVDAAEIAAEMTEMTMAAVALL